jgi:nucleoside-diphosphate-sugar epimerase
MLHPNTTHIIFGTGQLGLTVMDELVGQGKNVTLVNRSGLVKEKLPAGVTVIKGDARDAGVVAQICAQAEVVFHCAQAPYNQWPEQFPPIMTGILNGVAQTQAKLIFGDNLYMYGPTNGQSIHEDLPYAATGRKGRVRAELAKMLLEAHQAGKIRVAIGRASDFYGPRVTDSALGEMFFEAALASKVVNLVGNIDLPHTYTYIKDFARALVTLSQQDRALGRAWHVPSARTLTTRQMIDLAAAQLGQPIKPRVAGRFLISLLGLFNPMVREIKEMMYEFEEPYIVDHRQFEQTFGAQTTPHPQALQETIDWYRQRNQQG